MPNTFNYAQRFERELDQKYNRELLSAALSRANDRARFLNADTVNIPTVMTGGYGEHSRAGGWNRKDVSNTWEPYKLSHDRDVEFLVDVMDVDETNQVVSAANITNTFLTEHAVPELDCYRFSKLYADYTSKYGLTPDTTAITSATILGVFDEMMRKMTEAGVPDEGRMLYATPAVMKMLKDATGISRSVSVQTNNGTIDRRVSALDNVQITEVLSGRMKTAYDFTDDAIPAADAKQINLILIHPTTAVIAPIKHSAIFMFAPGQHTMGDGWLYQNRMYTDLFLLKNKTDGVQMNVDA